MKTKIPNPTEALLDMELGESITDLRMHKHCINSTIQRLKDRCNWRWHIENVYGTDEFRIIRIK